MIWSLADILLVLLSTTYAMVTTQSDDVNAKAVEEIIAEIDKMPSWPLLPWKPTNADRQHVQQQAAKLEDIALNIAKHSSVDVREALAQYNNMIREEKREWNKDRALFIVNKFLFDIPEFVTWVSPEMTSLHAGWGAPLLGDRKVPQPTDRVLARWPWFSDESGRWHFKTECRLLIYSGPPYDPVRHFDALLTTFGRRSISVDHDLK